MSIRRSGSKRKSTKKPISSIKRAVKNILPQNFEKRQAKYIAKNKKQIDKWFDISRNKKKIESWLENPQLSKSTNDITLAHLLQGEKEENTVHKTRIRQLETNINREKDSADKLRMRVLEQSDEITKGTRDKFDEKAKKTAGFILAGLLATGMVGVAYYGYLTGNADDDTRNFYEFWQDEVEYATTKYIDSRISDPNKTVPDHDFGEPVDANWFEEYEDLND